MRKTVLIIDDNREFAKTLCETIGTKGFKADCIYTRKHLETFMDADEKCPDYLLMDYSFTEDVRGQLVGNIRRRCLITKIILITGSSSAWNEAGHMIKNKQIDGYILKPFSANDFLSVAGSLKKP